MSGISDKIEAFITALLEEEESRCIDLKRNELAGIFNCVPSQINYVISTRFSPQRGYAVESKRGGGGYLRIRRISSPQTSPIRTVIESIDGSVSASDAEAYIKWLQKSGSIDEKGTAIMLAAVSDRSLSISQPAKDILRADILKNMLAAIQE
ncbi:MAG: CtsR family transcriptional regulator [bacterium]|nr:CtsR family transcriptional regulator [bacterium]